MVTDRWSVRLVTTGLHGSCGYNCYFNGPFEQRTQHGNVSLLQLESFWLWNETVHLNFTEINDQLLGKCRFSAYLAVLNHIYPLAKIITEGLMKMVFCWIELIIITQEKSTTTQNSPV